MRQETEAPRWWLVAESHTGQGDGLPRALSLERRPWQCARGQLLLHVLFPFQGASFSCSGVTSLFFPPQPQHSWGMGSIPVGIGGDAPIPGDQSNLPGEGDRVTA